MVAERKQEDMPIPSLPGGAGNAGPVNPVAGMSAADRVAQVQALQAMSPFVAMAPELKKLDVEKGFDLSQGAFNVRASTLERMKNVISDIRDADKNKVFNQHVEGLTFQEESQERPKHTVSGANTDLLPAEQALRMQGGAYDKANKLPLSRKGVIE